MTVQHDELERKFMDIEIDVCVSSKTNFLEEIICYGNAFIEVQCYLVKPLSK